MSGRDQGDGRGAIAFASALFAVAFALGAARATGSVAPPVILLVFAVDAVLLGIALLALRRTIADRPLILATLLSFAVTMPMLAFHIRGAGAAVWDGDAALFYRMAADWPWRPGGWWRYRLLVPWVAKTAPVGTNAAYAVIAGLSVAGTGVALSSLLGDLGFGARARNAGVVLYLASFAPLYNTFNYALPDPAAMLVLVLAARAIVRHRDRELALWLIVGVLTKEVVLFLVPAHWLYLRRGGIDWSAVRTTVFAATPAALLFLWLRFMPSEEARFTEFVGGSAWLFPWRHQPDNVARLYAPFAAGWGLVVLGLRGRDRWSIAAAGFAVPCLLSLLVTDAGRMLVFLLPFAIPAMLRAAGAPGRITRRGWWALGLTALSMRLWAPFLPLWAVPEPLRRGIALALLPVVVVLCRRAQPATSSSSDATSPASRA